MTSPVSVIFTRCCNIEITITTVTLTLWILRPIVLKRHDIVAISEEALYAHIQQYTHSTSQNPYFKYTYTYSTCICNILFLNKYTCTYLLDYMISCTLYPVCWINKLFAQRQHKWELYEPSQLTSHCITVHRESSHRIAIQEAGKSQTGRQGGRKGRTHWNLSLDTGIHANGLDTTWPQECQKPATLHFTVQEPWWCVSEWVGREEEGKRVWPLESTGIQF